jgi:hypothetical protein
MRNCAIIHPLHLELETAKAKSEWVRGKRREARGSGRLTHRPVPLASDPLCRLSLQRLSTPIV